MKITSQILGVEDMKKAFGDLEKKAQRAVLRAALRKAGRIVQKEARERAPKRVGTLKKNIAAKLSVREAGNSYVDVGYRKKAFYGRFVEKGTKRAQAKPYLEPALEAKKGEALDAFREALQVALLGGVPNDQAGADIEEV